MCIIHVVAGAYEPPKALPPLVAHKLLVVEAAISGCQVEVMYSSEY